MSAANTGMKRIRYARVQQQLRIMKFRFYQLSSDRSKCIRTLRYTAREIMHIDMYVVVAKSTSKGQLNHNPTYIVLPLSTCAKQHLVVHAIRVLRNLADDNHSGIVHGDTGDVGIAIERELRHGRHLRARRFCSTWTGDRIDVPRVAEAHNAISSALLFALWRALRCGRAQQKAGHDNGGTPCEPHPCVMAFVYYEKIDSHMTVRN